MHRQCGDRAVAARVCGAEVAQFEALQEVRVGFEEQKSVLELVAALSLSTEWLKALLFDGFGPAAA